MNQAAKEGRPCLPSLKRAGCKGTRSRILSPQITAEQPCGQSQLDSQHARTNSCPSQCCSTHQHHELGRQFLAGMAQCQPVCRQRLLRLTQQRAVAGQLRLGGNQLRQGGGLGLLRALQAAPRIGQLWGVERVACMLGA